MEPVRQLLVLGGLVFRKRIIVELGHALSDGFIVPPADVLHRLTQKIPDLERNNLVRPVHNDLVVDFWPDVLYPAQNGLVSLVIPVKILNVRPVHLVDGHSLLQNIHHISPGDVLNVRVDNLPTKKIHWHTPLKWPLEHFHFAAHSHSDFVLQQG